jgi:hypothetical protein
MTRNERYGLPVLLPPLAWFGSQQITGFMLHAGVPEGRHWAMALVGTMILLVGLITLTTTRMLISGNVGAAMKWGLILWSGVFSLAILFQALAAWLLAGSAR